MSSSLVWFRQDLRLADNSALHAAAARGQPIIALYVLDDATSGHWKPGGASRWWLHYSLEKLAASLAEHKITLLLARGNAADTVLHLVHDHKIDAVFWNRCYEPYAVRRDSELKDRFKTAGIEAHSFNGSLLHEPWTVLTGSQTPYKVFTPYWKAAQKAAAIEKPLPVPQNLKGANIAAMDRLADWRLLPTQPDWAGGLRDCWQPGEAAGQQRLRDFAKSMHGYAEQRNQPGQAVTSRLSPYLHFGEVSPRQVWHEIEKAGTGHDAEKFLSELGWREFSYYLLYHFPTLPESAFNPHFEGFKWRGNPAHLKAWQQGKTGYPIVDAGMRELWQTGWMHNRVRMITASFLIKHLGIDWRTGADWFWDTLVCADLAANSASWQWVAGSGADAAPYFRIFNPILQSEKFDAEGGYIRRYVPELAQLPAKYLHTPWETPEMVLLAAGVKLGETYPYPIVEHNTARLAALAAYRDLGGQEDEDDGG
jgi:deoxyribodipyrimidine photo-lyase